ncbi:MAG: S-layer homology domain-containing protein [Ruminiclostridium sp.]|nr:S-layer homology domain-containing protein [Ruminiclostridium sp.]
MKKRIFILTLVLSLLLCPVALAAAGGTISLEKVFYAPNEEITVTVSGITQQMVDDEAYVSVYQKGAEHSEYMNWTYLEVGTGKVVLEAPSELGSYEMRLYSKDHEYTDEVFVMSVPFQVGLAKQGKISLEKNAYQANQDISITVTGITEEMEKSKAYVSIYRKGAEHDEYGGYIYVKAGDSVVELNAPNLNGEFEVRLYSIDHNYTDESFVMSVPFTLSGAVQSKASEWAGTTVQKAEELGLIPGILKGADLTKPITRKEFAAVCVKLYEKLSGETAEPEATNPFTDTKDAEVLKAYKAGITSGTGAGKFDPDVILNREQAATMLTRVFKKVFVAGWSLDKDGKYTFNFTMPPKFADDDKISEWAKPSVYFMASHKIIAGVGNNKFAPKATTDAEKAKGYASATREQALAISLRITENMGDGSAASQIVPPN